MQKILLFSMKIIIILILTTIVFSNSSFAAVQPIVNAAGYIIPNQVAMGDAVDYVYTVDYDFNILSPAGSQNVKSIEISVPGFSVPSYAYSSDAGDTLYVDNGMSYISTVDTLYVTFDNPITDGDSDGSGTIEIAFKTKLFKNIHNFYAFLSNDNNNDDAGVIEVWENAQFSNVVTVTTLIKDILSNARAVPNVFSPDIDGKNDFTVIEFILAKVSTNVKILIFDSSDSLIATVFDDMLSPSEYAVDEGDIAGAMSLPGYWDGKDDDGNPVSEGVYYFQLIVETDEIDLIETGPVIVTYSSTGLSSLNLLNTKLIGNYPNPFNANTVISFYLGSEEDIHNVKLVIYSMNGQLVKTLTENKLFSGVHQISWNGEDRYGNKVSAGLYLYSLIEGNNVLTKKMLFLK